MPASVSLVIETYENHYKRAVVPAKAGTQWLLNKHAGFRLAPERRLCVIQLSSIL